MEIVGAKRGKFEAGTMRRPPFIGAVNHMLPLCRFGGGGGGRLPSLPPWLCKGAASLRCSL